MLEKDIKSRVYFKCCFKSILKVLRVSPSSCKDFLLHQTELLHMLSSWTREHVCGVPSPSLLLCRQPCVLLQRMLSEEQWRAVLLFAVTPFTGSSFEQPDIVTPSADTPPLEVSEIDVQFLAKPPPLSSVPGSPAVRERVSRHTHRGVGLCA